MTKFPVKYRAILLYMTVNKLHADKAIEKRVKCKSKIVKIANLLVSTVVRNGGNCNLIGHVGCFDCIVTYM